MVAVVGVSVSDLVVRTSVDPLHAAESSPAIATAEITRAMRARLPGARNVGLLITLFIELLLTGCMWMRFSSTAMSSWGDPMMLAHAILPTYRPIR
jgi:hypothetical protein